MTVLTQTQAPARRSARVVELHQPPWAENLYRLGQWRYKALYGGRGSGKALRADTPIPTPEGWTTMGELKPGDQVFGALGQPISVLAVHPQGRRDVWEMRFRHGDSIYADADHLWRATTHLWRKRRNRQGAGYEGPIVIRPHNQPPWTDYGWRAIEPRTTVDLTRSVVQGPRGDLNLSIPLAGALRLPEVDLPVPPYALGLWLGDGLRREACIAAARMDASYYRNRLAELGEILHDARPSSLDKPAPTYALTKTRSDKRTDPASFKSRLRGLGLMPSKRIPMAYLRASRRQRLALLAGLMDTDGTVDQDGSSATFTSTDEGLAQDMYELVTSLGVRATETKKPAMLNGVQHGFSWHIDFRPFVGCVTLPRKACRVRPERSQSNRYKQRMIEAITSTGDQAEMVCIEVDAPDSMFLAGRSMIPTHNTWSVATALPALGHQRRMRIVCVREHQKSIEESAKQEIELQIRRLGLERYYKITDQHIDHRENGTHFFFRGLSTVQEEDIKGWADVDVAWVEQAEMMSASSWEILDPTIRKHGAEIWLTFNPKNRYDPAYKTFVAQGRDNAWVRKVNYNDNPWFEDDTSLAQLRRDSEKYEPERYAHIWLGEPDDEGAERKVLPYALMDLCVKAWEKYDIKLDDVQGVVFGGLDVADTGTARNALGLRRGPCLFRLDRWRESTLGKTTRRMDGVMRDLGGTRLYFDVGGVGAGIRSHLLEMQPAPPYGIRPENFGGAVKGPKVLYTRGQTNEQFFARRNAQMGWGLRLRANMTQRLMEGEDVDMNKCLFINPELERREDVLAQFSQPIWEEDTSGRMKIDKQPDDAPSPDAYDGGILAFAYDSDNGLKRPV